MNLAKCHTPMRNAEGKITHCVDGERTAHSVENIRDAMTGGDDDSYGAVSWTSNIEDDDLIAIWGMSDDDMTMSDTQAPSTATEKENEDSGSDSNRIVSDGDNENVVSESTSTEETKAERKRDEEQSAERKRKRAYRRRRRITYWADNISYYGYYASWIFFGIFIIGRFAPSAPLISFIGIIGSIVSVSASLIASEVLGKLDGQYSAIRTVPITVVALILAAVGLYGLFASDPELSTAGVIGLLAWSFVPSLIDMVKQHEDDFEYRKYEYDDDGNVTNAGEFDDAASSGGYYRTYSSGNAFSAINEVFGIPQPVDPPPIEVSRDDMYDDEWGRALKSVEVFQDENGDVVLRPVDTSKEHEGRINETECARENNDTL